MISNCIFCLDTGEPPVISEPSIITETGRSEQQPSTSTAPLARGGPRAKKSVSKGINRPLMSGAMRGVPSVPAMSTERGGKPSPSVPSMSAPSSDSKGNHFLTFKHI